jgi:hypothetical protein
MLIGGGIFDADVGKALEPQQAGIAVATGLAPRRGVVAGARQRVIDA